MAPFLSLYVFLSMSWLLQPDPGLASQSRFHRSVPHSNVSLHPPIKGGVLSCKCASSEEFILEFNQEVRLFDDYVLSVEVLCWELVILVALQWSRKNYLGFY